MGGQIPKTPPKNQPKTQPKTQPKPDPKNQPKGFVVGMGGDIIGADNGTSIYNALMAGATPDQILGYLSEGSEMTGDNASRNSSSSFSSFSSSGSDSRRRKLRFL